MDSVKAVPTCSSILREPVGASTTKLTVSWLRGMPGKHSATVSKNTELVIGSVQIEHSLGKYSRRRNASINRDQYALANKRLINDKTDVMIQD